MSKSLKQRYQQLKEEIAFFAKKARRSKSAITLLCATKGRSVEQIRAAYAAGAREMGESRVQEALPKMAELPSDIRWHWIGTLQGNKVNKVVGVVSWIHAVDTLLLAQKISEASKKKGVITHILLQVNTSGEKTKHGWSIEEWRPHVEYVRTLPNIVLEGLMTIAPLHESREAISACFARLRGFAKELKLTHLSMGMSHDYPLAIQEGATFLRIGSLLFDEEGEREVVEERA